MALAEQGRLAHKDGTEAVVALLVTLQVGVVTDFGPARTVVEEPFVRRRLAVIASDGPLMYSIDQLDKIVAPYEGRPEQDITLGESGKGVVYGLSGAVKRRIGHVIIV